MTVSILPLYEQLGSDNARMDPLRIFGGKGAFIGIVAAGLIVVSKAEAHNLKTAAHASKTVYFSIFAQSREMQALDQQMLANK
jgi:uncharacterized membrane protein YhiD involved in acid resistance